MRQFHDYNPLAVTLYYAAVITVTMFSMNPVIIALSLLSSVLTYCLYAKGSLRTHLFSLLLFLILAVINPLTVHNGVTVLFYLNSRPITLEATLYGASAAATVTAALYRLRSLSHDITSDKLMYLFGRFSPKLALLLSLSLRFVGLFKRRWHTICNAQQALGLYRDGNLIDAVRGRLRVLSILITWSLENGVITAQSMDARGYGSRRRSSYAIYRFRLRDSALLAATLILTALCIAGIAAGSFSYYPAVQSDLFSPLSVAGYFAYAILGVLPIIINTKEAIRWRILLSGI